MEIAVSLSQIRMNITLVILLLLTFHGCHFEDIEKGNLNFVKEEVEDLYYKHNDVRCEKCSKGQKVTNHCSKDLQKSGCVACEGGTFFDRLNSYTVCNSCTDCSHTSRIVKSICTSERDAECGCPDNKFYYNLRYCRTCHPPKIKKVRDKNEYCEDCESGSYYNNTVEDCVKCDMCTGDQETLHHCNVTHNTHCKLLPVSSPSTTQVSLTGEHEDSLNGGEIASIVIAIMIIIVLCLLVCLCFKKKKFCFRVAEKTSVDPEEMKNLKNNDYDTQPTESSRESSRQINNSVVLHSETQNSSPPPEAQLSSKPIWMPKIYKILIDNLDQLDVFVSNLGTPEINATAKWDQLNGIKIETRFLKFMDVWYEQTTDPSLNQIVTALQDMNKNDIIKIIKKDAYLKKLLNCKDEFKFPIQATDDGDCDRPDKILLDDQLRSDISICADCVDNKHNTVVSKQNIDLVTPNGTDPDRISRVDSVDNRHDSLILSELNINLVNPTGTDPDQTYCKRIGSDLDEEQTNPKQPLSVV